MSRPVQALILGSVFVALVKLIAHYQVATPIPFLLLAPGILAGALAPDTGFNPEGDTHPWGPISTAIAYTVNVLLYSGIIYFVLPLIHSARRPETNPTHQPDPRV